MSHTTEITTIAPTPCLRQVGDALHQLVQMTVTHTEGMQTGEIRAIAQGIELVTPVTLTAGESTVEVEIPEVTAPCEATFTVMLAGSAVARKSVAWIPPKRWIVHVVQLSHHDVGYTNLASNVLPEHDRWLDAIIDMAEATQDFPEEARFRMVVEQAWSIDHFLRTARPERVTAILDLLRRGDVELTAFFGNIVTEMCGHETLARSVYHAFRLKREYGIPILSAEHNDVPGFSWGVSQVLAAAGIKLFCPGLPYYYSWGHPGATSFWDEEALFGFEGRPPTSWWDITAGRPGAFWWEAPSGKRVLFWCNNQGCGGDSRAEMPRLIPRLRWLEENDYPYTVLRWPVQGGHRDNSPYIEGYAHAIRAWNERWAFPRLISSTNTRFYQELLPQLPAELPVFRGELPGQDYPVGAASTACATAVNRRNHAALPAAEALAVMASSLTDYPYQAEEITAAYEGVLWHDEHTWGHHFPAGPTACASELEKAVHAHRAAALAHDVENKAMARIADAVHLEEEDLHLVVFNPLPVERSGVVTTPLREIENCGSDMVAEADGHLRGVPLGDRWHVDLPREIVEGKFKLIDVETGEAVPFQITVLDSPYAPLPFAGQRLGLGAGGARYGVLDLPGGIACDLTFHAGAVPPLGYRTYRLQPLEDQPSFPTPITATETMLENAWYRLEVDPATGCVRSLIDKDAGRELIDPAAPHPFGALVIRDPFGGVSLAAFQAVYQGDAGPQSASLRIVFAGKGHPHIEQTLRLFADEKRIEVAVHLLKDPTPLLEAYLAFPFNVPEGAFRYEGPFSVLDPRTDLLPGAYADRVAVQNQVVVSDGAYSVLWSSLDAPVAALAHLWPGRVSPAHSAILRKDIEHPRQEPADLRGGRIYSLLTANNFGTNFAVSQSGDMLFRYQITTRSGPMADAQAVALGQHFQTPFSTIFTKHSEPRPLPPVGSFLSVEPQEVRLTVLKRAEDGEGLIVRMWNAGAQRVAARVALPALTVSEARVCTLAEEDTSEVLPCEAHAVTIPIDAHGVATVRLHLSEARKEKDDDQ